MQEFEQQFIAGKCKVCSLAKRRTRSIYSYGFGKLIEHERIFVTSASNPREAICTNCGFKTNTSDLIKTIGGELIE